jgi:lysine 2,3-aminomutase
MRHTTAYTNISPTDWNNWRWQQRNRVTTLDELDRAIDMTIDEKNAFNACKDRFKAGITPYYLRLIDLDDTSCPIRKQAIPSSDELLTWPGELEDPLAEERHMPVPGLTHRYPDRALLYATHNCAMYCRFCTRKRKVGDATSALGKIDLSAAIDHIRSTPTIRDVIISGGDPLSLSNERLAAIFEELSSIKHVEIARLGTRNLVTLPQRVDSGLADVLRSAQSRHLAVWVMTHFNHPRECTEAAFTACDRIIATGTPVQNQMVLLRGVNDNVDTVAGLNKRLLQMRVKPYYILHADLAQGIGHFRTSIESGLSIIKGLRGYLSGLGVPQYVVDLPYGGGKVALVPEAKVRTTETHIIFRNYQGREISVPNEHQP